MTSGLDAARLDGLRIGFVGAGRLGQALAWSLAAADLPVVAVSSARVASAMALATPIPGCRVMTPQLLVNACDLVFVHNTARQMRIDVSMSNSFGFGGTNGTLVFRRV